MKDEIVQDRDPVLRKKTKPLSQDEIRSKETKELISCMKKLLSHEQYGVGLAAPQVGVSRRLFIIAGRAFLPEKDATEDKEPEDMPAPPDRVFINPEIIRKSRKKVEMAEGCLSVRGKYGTVMRHEKASIKALDEHGKPFTLHGSGLLSHIFQHEMDHLEGTLYIDKAIKLRDENERETLREKFPA